MCLCLSRVISCKQMACTSCHGTLWKFIRGATIFVGVLSSPNLYIVVVVVVVVVISSYASTLIRMQWATNRQKLSRKQVGWSITRLLINFVSHPISVFLLTRYISRTSNERMSECKEISQTHWAALKLVCCRGFMCAHYRRASLWLTICLVCCFLFILSIQFIFTQ